MIPHPCHIPCSGVLLDLPLSKESLALLPLLGDYASLRAEEQAGRDQATVKRSKLPPLSLALFDVALEPRSSASAEASGSDPRGDPSAKYGIMGLGAISLQVVQVEGQTGMIMPCDQNGWPYQLKCFLYSMVTPRLGADFADSNGRAPAQPGGQNPGLSEGGILPLSNGFHALMCSLPFVSHSFF